MIVNTVLCRKGSKQFKNFCMVPYFECESVVLFNHLLNAPKLNRPEASVLLLYISKEKSL